MARLAAAFFSSILARSRASFFSLSASSALYAFTRSAEGLCAAWPFSASECAPAEGADDVFASSFAFFFFFFFFFFFLFPPGATAAASVPPAVGDSPAFSPVAVFPAYWLVMLDGGGLWAMMRRECAPSWPRTRRLFAPAPRRRAWWRG